MGKCCKGFVGDIFNGPTNAIQDLGRSFDKAVLQPIGDVVEGILEDPKKLAMVALSVLAPGAGTALGTALGLTGTAASIVGQVAINTALNGGDVKSAIISAAIPVVGKELAGVAAASFVDAGMDVALAESAGKVVSGAGLAAAQGKDPLQALISGGLSAGTAAVTRDIPGFSDLPVTAQRAINSAVAAELSGRDPTQALINSAISAGTNALRSAVNAPISEQEPTLAEILNPPVGPAPVEPALVEPSPVDDPTLEEILSLPPEPAPVEPAPVEPSPVAPSPVNDPTLEEILSSPAEPAPVEPEAVPEPSPVDDPTLEEMLGQPDEPSPVDDPTLEEILSQPKSSPVEPPDDSRPDEEEPGSKGPTDEDTARRFKEEYDRYLAYMEAGEPPPPEYGIQDMGITDESWDSYTQQMLDMDARGELPSQWRPGADGSFTYTDDDGSTITIDESGDIINFTEAPSGMLPGEEPAPVTPAPVTPGTPALVTPTTPSTPTTPTTPTAPTTPANPTTPATPKTDAPSTQNLVALLALLGSGGGGSSAPPTQVAPAEVQLMEEIFGSNLFSKDPGGISAADAKAGKRNFNNGGSVDELLHLLRG